MVEGTAVRYSIDPDRSKVAIEARSSVHPIHGEAAGVAGWVTAAVADGQPDLSTPPRAEIELPVDRLKSGNPLYDGEMQRRVEARKYPTITGSLEGIEATGAGTYRARGDLTFHGRTRSVECEVRAEVTGAELRADWELTLDIRDFDVTPPRLLMLKVYPDVKVQVHVEAVREDGAT